MKRLHDRDAVGLAVLVVAGFRVVAHQRHHRTDSESQIDGQDQTGSIHRFRGTFLSLLTPFRPHRLYVRLLQCR